MTNCEHEFPARIDGQLEYVRCASAATHHVGLVERGPEPHSEDFRLCDLHFEALLDEAAESNGALEVIEA